MSRPNHALELGVARASASTALLGSMCVNSDGHADISTNRRMRKTDTQKMGFFFSERQASDPSDRAASSAWVGPASAETAIVDDSVMADPRVEHAVQQVDEQVDEQEHQHEDRHRA